MATIGIAHFAPDLEPNDDYEMVCVGISGYWAGENGSPRIENSPSFQDVRSALEWGTSRARTVFIRVSVDEGPTYYYGDRHDGDPEASYPRLNLDDAEACFVEILGRVVS